MANVIMKNPFAIASEEMLTTSVYFILKICDTWLSLDSHRANTFGLEK